MVREFGRFEPTAPEHGVTHRTKSPQRERSPLGSMRGGKVSVMAPAVGRERCE
jgi:hypothetical protein